MSGPNVVAPISVCITKEEEMAVDIKSCRHHGFIYLGVYIKRGCCCCLYTPPSRSINFPTRELKNVGYALLFLLLGSSTAPRIYRLYIDAITVDFFWNLKTADAMTLNFNYQMENITTDRISVWYFKSL